jgi:transcriptional regulator with XRE-family HTH domain
MVGFLLGGFIPTCYAQTSVEIAKLEISMKINDFAFYRKRIGQTQEKIAEVLSIPLPIYLDFEQNRREPSQRVKEAFGSLLIRFPGSTDLSKPKIKAIDAYRASYVTKHGHQPFGKHWIPFSFATSKKTLVDFSPYDDGSEESRIQEWINSHDLPYIITREYIEHLKTLSDSGLNDELQFWDEVYTAQHYGKYKSQKPKTVVKKAWWKKFIEWIP